MAKQSKSPKPANIGEPVITDEARKVAERESLRLLFNN
jgi:hypothetical protein